MNATSPDTPAQPSPWKLRAGDDWHVHLRDGEVLAATTPHTARQFRRALIMPNLTPPITTVTAALAYRQRILKSLLSPHAIQETRGKNHEAGPFSIAPEKDSHSQGGTPKAFEPLMSLYLQENTSAEEIRAVSKEPDILGIKYYPRGATTNAQAGIRSLEHVSLALAAMEKHNVPLMIHGESTASDIDVFERETDFIETTLTSLLKRFPGLRVTLEHISTRRAVEFIQAGPERLAASITLHHLLLTRNDLLADGLRPHFYCKPLVKTEADRKALLKVALSGEKRFFFGSDSAPHPQHEKESACGCAGVFSAPYALPLLAELFASHHAHAHLETFISCHGAAHYDLPLHEDKIELVMEDAEETNPMQIPQIPLRYRLSSTDSVIPFGAGEKLRWKARACS